MWCIHTAQHTDTSASRGHAALSRGHVVTMARVEELADLALDLSGDAEADAAAAPQSDDHPHWWSRAEASALFPRALPATDWDVGNGLSGLSAVEGCALLAAALAAGGPRGGATTATGTAGSAAAATPTAFPRHMMKALRPSTRGSRTTETIETTETTETRGERRWGGP